MSHGSPLLERWLALAPSFRPAVLDAHGAHPYSALVRSSRAVAAALLEGRASLEGERVALLAEPGAAFVAGLYGAFLSGACGLVLSPLHPAPEVAWFLKDGEVRTVLVSRALRATLPPEASTRRLLVLEDLLHGTPADTLPGLLPGAAALQIYTSGTTGKPKGAVVTHGNLSWQQASLAEAWGMAASDVLLHCLPLHHVHGLAIALLNVLGVGGTARMMPTFGAAAAWDALADSTVFMAVPTLYAKLLAALDAADADAQQRWTRAASNLRLSTSGSAALPVSVAARWRALTGALPLERYGMTELGAVLSNPLDPAGRLPGHVGHPLPGVELRVVDESGALAEVGELQVTGPCLFAGYHRRAEATAAAFAEAGGRRWFRTGDTVQRGEDGSVRILGRTSVDVLKSGGFKLSALELEELLREHPAVAEVAVVGLPDETWGDRVVACVVPRPGQAAACEEAALREWAKGRVATYKVPRQVLCFEELPRNALGKVVKPELVSAVRARNAAAAAPAPRPTSS
ncbi:MAG: AMP-binding protein [Deltaproteobacteria bacterium]|nr:AMP-binding protein [Deltaproteobacteria bacterium]